MDTQHSAKIHKFYEVIKAQNSLALHQLLQAKPAHTGCSSHDPQLISPQPCNQHATNQQTRPCHHEIIHLMQFTCSVKHTLPCQVPCIPARTMPCHVRRDRHLSTHSSLYFLSKRTSASTGCAESADVLCHPHKTDHHRLDL